MSDFYLLYAPSRRAQTWSPARSRPCRCRDHEEGVSGVWGNHALGSAPGTGCWAETFNLIEIHIQELF